MVMGRATYDKYIYFSLGRDVQVGSQEVPGSSIMITNDLLQASVYKAVINEYLYLYRFLLVITWVWDLGKERK